MGMRRKAARRTPRWRRPSGEPSLVAAGARAGDASRHPIDRRRPWYVRRRMLLHQLERLGHRPFELWIVPANHIRGRLRHLDVRRDAFILDGPLSVHIVERQVRRRDRTVVDRERNAERPNESAPRARADERTELRDTEVI